MELLKFEPLLKQTLWGGDRIIPFKGLDTRMENVGESWEISGVKGHETVVSEGAYRGRRLNDLVRELKGQLVGGRVYERYGDEFPLLIKFIDARQDLSIQVHPDDATARRQGHPRGKTEMWYCLGGVTNDECGVRNDECGVTNDDCGVTNDDCGVTNDDCGVTNDERGGRPSLYCGLKRQLTAEEYAAMVANDTITEALARYEVNDGDVFFIPAGRIHAIGAGCFVAEIQQTSDVTYRIYDYGRRDRDGHLRELHTREAAEAIDYSVLADYRTHYDLRKNSPETVVRCDYFRTSVYDFDYPVTIDYSDVDSFEILICVEGEAMLTADGRQTPMRRGETVLIPACVGEVRVRGKVKFIETLA